MATLAELGQGYLDAAARLRVGLEEARNRLEGLEGGERAALEREIHLLEGMLREVREVGQLVRHYYEPAYFRDRRYVL